MIPVQPLSEGAETRVGKAHRVVEEHEGQLRRLAGGLIRRIVGNHSLRVQVGNQLRQPGIVERRGSTLVMRRDVEAGGKAVLAQHADGAAVEVIAEEQLDLRRKCDVGFVVLPLGAEKNGVNLGAFDDVAAVHVDPPTHCLVPGCAAAPSAADRVHFRGSIAY
jgi:hypothetical protein